MLSGRLDMYSILTSINTYEYVHLSEVASSTISVVKWPPLLYLIQCAPKFSWE